MNDKLGFGGGPTFDPFWLLIVVLDVFCLIFALHSDMHELYFVFINCVLILFLDKALWSVAQVRIHFHSDHSLCMFRLTYCAHLRGMSIDFLVDCHINFIVLVETRL